MRDLSVKFTVILLTTFVSNAEQAASTLKPEHCQCGSADISVSSDHLDLPLHECSRISQCQGEMNADCVEIGG